MRKLSIAICCCIMCIISTICCYKPISVKAEDANLTFNAKSAILVDFNTDEVLFEQNADEKVPVASIVKLMTLLITFEEIDAGNLCLSEKLTTTENASGMGGSQVFIDPYVEYTVEEMVKSIIVASANDASVALAEKISGTETAFVSKMNERAKQLGLSNTIYVNASGLDEPGQHSTARDVAKLTKEVMKHKEYFNYSTIWIDKLVHPSGRETDVVNTNKLIRYFKGCDGGKTGSTDEAGYCLTASALKNGMRLIGVVLGAKTPTERFNETSKLLNFGFSNFENKQLVSKNDVICQAEILRSKIKTAPVYANENFFVVARKGDLSDFQTSVELIEKISAPVGSSDKVGTLVISKNGVVIKKIDLVFGTEIKPKTFGDAFKEAVSLWQ